MKNMLLFVFICAYIHTTNAVTVVNLQRFAACLTPNGENAICIPLEKCSVIYKAIRTYDRSAIQFAKQSQCGYDTEVLICCGTVAASTNILPSVPSTTPVHQTTNKPREISPSTKSTFSPTTISGNQATSEPTEINPSTKSTFSPPETTTNRIDVWHDNPLLPNRTICGYERGNDRIYGGKITRIDEFPWMALIRYKNRLGVDVGFKCGGTLINNRYVLTAAHCIAGRVLAIYELSNVRLGEWDYNKEEDCIELEANRDCADPVIDVRIEEAIPHPFYTIRTGNNDIGLIRLERNIEYSDFVRPICLPPVNFPAPPVGANLTIAGWGTTESGKTSSVKLKVDVPITDSKTCSEKLWLTVRHTQICAGGRAGEDSCSGDSGGPLMNFFSDSDDKKKQWYQEGVVSKGIACGQEGFPGVYTRAARYVNWISSNIKE